MNFPTGRVCELSYWVSVKSQYLPWIWGTLIGNGRKSTDGWAIQKLRGMFYSHEVNLMMDIASEVPGTAERAKCYDVNCILVWAAPLTYITWYFAAVGFEGHESSLCLVSFKPQSFKSLSAQCEEPDTRVFCTHAPWKWSQHLSIYYHTCAFPTTACQNALYTSSSCHTHS